MIEVTPAIHLDENELKLEYVRASGPGGQNVNKVATAVQLRFDAAHSPALPDEVRRRLTHLAGSRMTQDGILLIDARRYRTQEQNRQDALDRLVTLVRRAAEKPRPRKPTRPTEQARRRRLEAKRRHSQTKQLRRSIEE